MNRLETPRLFLRPLASEDAEALFRITGDPEIMQYWTSGPDRSLADVARRLRVNQAHIQKHGFGDWAAEIKSAPGLIGFCGLQYQCVSGRDRVGIGYALHKTFWNQGYAVEAARCVIDHAFLMLRLDEVIATVSVDNRASLKLLKKCGFTFEHETIYDGVPRLIYYRTTKHKDLV